MTVAYQRHSTTSKAAAASFAEKAPTVREQVFAVFVSRLPDGMTDDEAFDATGLKPNTCRPRRCELVQEGRLVDKGVVRKGKEGLDQTVWFANPSQPRKKTLREMGCKTQDQYYLTEHWQNFREGYYSRNPRVCYVTGDTQNIDLHHKHYDTLGAERDEDVVPLRRDWHELGEKLIKEQGVPRDKVHEVLKQVYEFSRGVSPGRQDAV